MALTSNKIFKSYNSEISSMLILVQNSRYSDYKMAKQSKTFQIRIDSKYFINVVFEFIKMKSNQKEMSRKQNLSRHLASSTR